VLFVCSMVLYNLLCCIVRVLYDVVYFVMLFVCFMMLYNLLFVLFVYSMML